MEIDIGRIFGSHRTDEEGCETTVRIKDVNYRLRGQRATLIPLTAPLVELATRQSTPDGVMLSDDAAQQFAEKAVALVRNGTRFYTCLRGTWNLPAFAWQVIE